MQDGNWYLLNENAKLRRDEVWAELAHERFLAEHGLDLFSVTRARFARVRVRFASVRARLARQTRHIDVAQAPRPLRAAHRALPRGAHLVEPQPTRAGRNEGDAAA